jgi:PAS domain S-box-containing protein
MTDIPYFIHPLRKSTTTLRIAIDLAITNNQLRQQLQQQEATIQESEERLKTTLEATRTGFWEWNIQTRKIQWSDNLEPFFGLRPGEFDGSLQMFADRLHPEDRDRVLAAINHTITTGENYEIAFRVLYPNGRIRWALSQGKVFYDKDGQPVRMVGNDIDITDRKQAEITLRESEQRYAALAKISPVGIFRTDTQGDCLYTNDRWCELAGLSPLEAKGKGWLNALHPEDRDRVCAEWYHAAELNQPFRSEYRFQTPEGVVSWLIGQATSERDGEGNLIGYVGTVTDITVRKQVEKALQGSEKQFRQLAENIDAVFWIRDAVAQRINYVSPAYQRLWGLNPQDLYEDLQAWVNYIHPDDREPTEKAFQEKAPSGQFDQEYRIVLPNGQVRWVRDRCFPLYSETGEIYRFTGIAEDITNRKQAEEALQESEQKLRLFVKYAPVSVAMFDRNMHYLAASQRLIDEYHMGSIESVLGRSHYETFPIPMPDHWRQAHQRGLAGNIEKCDEDCVVLADGSLHWLRWEVHPWYTGTGEVGGIFIFVDNITQRKQTEVVLRENEQLLRLAITGAGQGIWDWDMETQVLTWDARCKEIFGLPPDFPVTYEWHLEALHPVDRQRVQAAATIALNERTEFVEEYRTFHPNGAMYWILARGCGFYDAMGKPYRMSGTVIDITARKQVEIDLQERNAHVKLLYETTRDLLSNDQPLTLIQSVFEDLKALVDLDVYFNYMLNKQQQKLHLISYAGVSAEQAQEIAWLDLGVAICGTVAQQRRQFMQTDLQHCTDPKAALVRSLGLTAYCAQPLIVQDKLFGTLSFGSCTRLEFTPSEQNLFQAICDQIAIALERSELFSSLQQQTEELIRVNRIKDEFLAILSHELRSPLNPILGWAKLLQTRTFDSAKTAEALATIERNAKLQTQLIDDLLDVAKILRGKLSLEIAPVDLVFVIEAAIDTVRAAAITKNIHLHPVLPQIGQVSGDATRLQQVVWNLLSNAIKFTPNNGHVEIRLERAEDQAYITVSDTGKGIKPDFLPYIFETFRQEDATTTRQYGGLGLGLSIVRHLVEAHGGTIGADSLGEGQGATFTIRLPLLKPEPDNNRAEEWLEELDLKGVRVLAVDDEPDACELLSALLTQYGAEVLTVNTAMEVLTNLESFRPDIVISDIGMPNMDGFSLIQNIRALPTEKGGQIPAIALTAYAREEDYQQAIANGYECHVTKPLNPDQLVRAVMVLYAVREKK